MTAQQIGSEQKRINQNMPEDLAIAKDLRVPDIRVPTGSANENSFFSACESGAVAKSCALMKLLSLSPGLRGAGWLAGQPRCWPPINRSGRAGHGQGQHSRPRNRSGWPASRRAPSRRKAKENGPVDQGVGPRRRAGASGDHPEQRPAGHSAVHLPAQLRGAEGEVCAGNQTGFFCRRHTHTADRVLRNAALRHLSAG